MAATEWTGTVPRKVLSDALAGLLPSDWKIIPYEDGMGLTDQVTVTFSQKNIKNSDQAPVGFYAVNFLLDVIEPSVVGTDGQEDRLDAEAITLWEALMAMKNVIPNTATKGMFNDQYMAYEIDMDLLVQRG